MAVRADLDAFHSKRLAIRGELALGSLSRSFGPGGEMSAAEFAFLIEKAPAVERADWIVAMAREAARGYTDARLHRGLDSLGLSRVLHTAGSVLAKLAERDERVGREITRALASGLTVSEKTSLRKMGAPVEHASRPNIWAGELKEAAFRHLGQTIVYRGGAVPHPPKNVLRSDEIVWGRAPARLDLGGGWTDTPPYSLERGGCVINAAVNLNGQAPIQAYARVIERPEIRINSIDHSTRVVVRTLEGLLDYRKPGSQFALAKAALALAGFAPDAAAWPAGVRTLEAMLRRFGGGIELTTLAAIPSGSGLGTSSIMGAVLLSIVGRMVGRPLTSRELFHSVLKLEQELTTGGGWQDQIGGVIEGVKMIEADKGLVPDPRIHFVPADLLDPATNGGRTLLYYTGLRRLAKNILHEVVGRYLDRDRSAMETLRRLHAFPPLMAEAMAMRDMDQFGELIDLAWQLNVDLDPDHSTPMIAGLREAIRPHVLGSKLLGAGGGGFLLMVCGSPEEAAAVRGMLEKKPPNGNARFFDYSISRTGLVVTVC
jgi:galactokinase/mevalonate kinase-like predicted kinase